MSCANRTSTSPAMAASGRTRSVTLVIPWWPRKPETSLRRCSALSSAPHSQTSTRKTFSANRRSGKASQQDPAGFARILPSDDRAPRGKRRQRRSERPGPADRRVTGSRPRRADEWHCRSLPDNDQVRSPGLSDYEIVGKIRRGPPLDRRRAVANDSTKPSPALSRKARASDLFFCEQGRVYRRIFSGHHRHCGACGNSDQPRLQAFGEISRKPDAPFRFKFDIDHQRRVRHRSRPISQ